MRKLVALIFCMFVLFPSATLASTRPAPSLAQARSLVHHFAHFAHITHMRRLRDKVVVSVRESWEIEPEGEPSFRTESHSVLHVYWSGNRLFITNVEEFFIASG